jgi:hypothetical protein
MKQFKTLSKEKMFLFEGTTSKMGLKVGNFDTTGAARERLRTLSDTGFLQTKNEAFWFENLDYFKEDNSFQTQSVSSRGTPIGVFIYPDLSVIAWRQDPKGYSVFPVALSLDFDRYSKIKMITPHTTEKDFKENGPCLYETSQKHLTPQYLFSDSFSTHNTLRRTQAQIIRGIYKSIESLFLKSKKWGTPWDKTFTPPKGNVYLSPSLDYVFWTESFRDKSYKWLTAYLVHLHTQSPKFAKVKVTLVSAYLDKNMAWKDAELDIQFLDENDRFCSKADHVKSLKNTFKFLCYKDKFGRWDERFCVTKAQPSTDRTRIDISSLSAHKRLELLKYIR